MSDPEPDRGAWRREARRRALLPLAIAVVGIVVVIVGSGALQIVGWGILGVAVTIAISLVFLEIGLSEDRDRAAGRE
jgi:hypothetical protein